MVVKSWNGLKRNECMDAWMHGCMIHAIMQSCNHAVMQLCNSPNNPSCIPVRLTSYKFFPLYHFTTLVFFLSKFDIPGSVLDILFYLFSLYSFTTFAPRERGKLRSWEKDRSWEKEVEGIF
jgi:hypothetical protein